MSTGATTQAGYPLWPGAGPVGGQCVKLYEELRFLSGHGPETEGQGLDQDLARDRRPRSRDRKYR